MYRLHLFKAGLLVYGLGFITLGIIILLQGQVVLEVASVFGGIILITHGLHLFFNMIIAKYRAQALPALIAGSFNVLCGVLAFFMPRLTIKALLILFTIYVFLNAAVKLIDFAIAVKNNSRRKYMHFISAMFFTTFGIMTCFITDMGIKSLLVVAGIYLILYGVCKVRDFASHMIPMRVKTGIKRGVRISLPVFISAFMPYRFMNDFNKYITGADDDETGEDFPRLRRRKNKMSWKTMAADSEPPEIEVLIHISKRGAGRMGHCDLIIDDEVLSYGNYDPCASKFFRIYGDGVLFKADKSKYIEYSVKGENKTVICYGLRLNERQKARIKSEVRSLMETAYRWEMPDTGEKTYSKSAKRMLMWEKTGAECFKFRSGSFKNYFVLSTNCVLLADSILGKAGTDIIKINGIITPGSYFDYLQGQFFLEDGLVSSRVIYSNAARIPLSNEKTPRRFAEHI